MFLSLTLFPFVEFPKHNNLGNFLPFCNIIAGINIGAVIVPYQFSSADFSVGIGLQFLLDSDAKNDLLISLVVPFSYKVGGKTSN